MRKTLMLPALVAGLGLSFAALAADRHDRGDHHRHHRGPMMEELRQLDLSEDQRSAVRKLFEDQREQFRAERESLRALHQAWNATIPGTPAYRTAAAKLADAQAEAARTRVQRHAETRTQIYGLLTETQKAQFREELAKQPERRGPRDEDERPEAPKK